MTHPSSLRRLNPVHTLAAVTAVGCLLMTASPFAIAQSAAPTGEVDTVKIRMRPHCEKLSMTECPQYAVKDPVTLETPILVPGSILDMDIMIENPKALPIRRARAWISYDPNILEGKKVEIGKKFPVVTPGEADFNAAQGYVQIGVSTEGTTEAKNPLIPMARIQFLVKAAPQGGKTALSYYDVVPGLQAHTLVTRTDGPSEKNVLHPAVGTLIVRSEGPQSSTASAVSSAAVSSATSVSTEQASVSSAEQASVSSAGTFAPVSATSSLAAVSSSTSSEVSSIAPVSSSSESNVSSAASSSVQSSDASGTSVDTGRSTFVLLQVQNLRLTTEGSTVYLAWDALRSSELQGYNVYYGAESGRYLQRRSVAGDANTLAVRALPLDTTYYFAIRAVNGKNEESAFSQEVAVKVGSPATSTAPLAQLLQDNGPRGKNPIDNVQNPPAGTPGATGLSSTLLLLILASAVIGTLFAFRRQLSAVATPPHA